MNEISYYLKELYISGNNLLALLAQKDFCSFGFAELRFAPVPVGPRTTILII